MRTVFGEVSIPAASCGVFEWNNLASLYYDIGEYEKAFKFFKRALEIREKVLGHEHPDVAVLLSNLANLYYNMGRSEEALSLFEHSIKIFEIRLGAGHPYFKQTEKSIEFLKAMKEK